AARRSPGRTHARATGSRSRPTWGAASASPTRSCASRGPTQTRTRSTTPRSRRRSRIPGDEPGAVLTREARLVAVGLHRGRVALHRDGRGVDLRAERLRVALVEETHGRLQRRATRVHPAGQRLARA